MSNTSGQIGPTGDIETTSSRVDETGEAISEQVSDNYFERVNAEFERRMLLGEVTDENLSDQIREIRQREANREGFGGIVMDFFRSPGQALRWLATPMLAPIFTGWMGQLGRLREQYEAGRDRIMDEIDDVVDNATPYVEGAQELAEDAINVVREHPFMTGIAASLAGFGGFRLLGGLPIDFNSLRRGTPPSLLLRAAPLAVGGLVSLGRIGITAFGLFKLYEYLEDHPNLLGNIPDRAEDMMEWVREKFAEMNIPEMTDEAIEYVGLILSGQKTPQEIFEDTGIPDAVENLQEREGYISVEEFVHRQRDSLHTFFEPVFNHANSLYERNQALANTLAVMAAVSRPGRAVLSSPFRGLWTLAQINVRFAGNHPIAFAGLMGGFGAVAWYMHESGVRVVPESRDQLKADILEFIEENEAAFMDATNGQFDIEQISNALDYALWPEKLAELELNVEEFVDAASGAAVEVIDLSPSERLFAQNDMGMDHLRSEARRYLSEHESYDEIVAALDEFELSFFEHRAIDEAALQTLISTLEAYGINIKKEGDIYVWTMYAPDSVEIIAMNNLCIDPALSEDNQYDAANDFYILTEGGLLSGIDTAGTVFNMITQDAREFFGRTFNDDEIPADNPVEWLSNMILRITDEEDGLLNIVPAMGAITVEAAGEAFILGPISILGGIVSDLVEDGKIDAQYIMAEYAEGLMPVLVVGTAYNVTRSLAQGRGPRLLSSTLKAAGAPLQITGNYFRYFVFSDYRRRVNAGVTQSVFGRIERMTMGRFGAQRFANASRVRAYYDALNILDGTLNLRSQSYFRRNEAARSRVADLLANHAGYTGHSFGEIKRMLLTREGLSSLKDSVRNHLDIDRALMRGGNDPEAVRSSLADDAEPTRNSVADTDTARASADADVESRGADMSRAEADMRIDVHAPDTARPRGAVDGGGGRGRSVAAVGAVAAAAATGAVLNNARDNDNEPAQEQESQADEEPEAEVMSESNEANEDIETVDPALEARYMLLPFSEPYYEIDDLLRPETIRDLNGDQFFIYVEMYKQIHIEQVDATLDFIRRNEHYFLEYFRDASERKLNIGKYMELEYDAEEDRLQLNYSSASRFRNNLWDSYDQIRIFDRAYDLAGVSEDQRPHQMMYDLRESLYASVNEIHRSDMTDEEKTEAIAQASEEAFEEMRRINNMVTAAYTTGNLATYMPMYIGEARDLYDVGNAAARGQLGRFAESSLSFAVGAVTLGAARPAIGSARAGRLITRMTQTLARNADNAADSMRALRGVQRYADYTRYGLLAFDAFRFTYAPVSINKTEII